MSKRPKSLVFGARERPPNAAVAVLALQHAALALVFLIYAVLIGKGAAVVSESGCSWCSFADGSTTGEPCNMCGRNGGVVGEAKEDGKGQA